jgi:hypothetical protein
VGGSFSFYSPFPFASPLPSSNIAIKGYGEQECFQETCNNVQIGILEIIVRVGLTVATSILFGLVFLSYWRTRTGKMLLISLGFAVFFVHALITIPELFNDAYQIAMSENLHLLIHLVALVFILLGILKE